MSTTLLIFLQLLLGAAMRHLHAGLAVPDFPLAYGKWWPPMDPAALEIINRSRLDARDYNPVTTFQIGLHMAHRLGAALVLLAAGRTAWLAARPSRQSPWLFRAVWIWLALVAVLVLAGQAA